MKDHYWKLCQSMTLQKAFQFLVEGNVRFVNNLHANRACSIYTKSQKKSCL
jgi:hypothetical protein